MLHPSVDRQLVASRASRVLALSSSSGNSKVAAPPPMHQFCRVQEAPLGALCRAHSFPLTTVLRSSKSLS